MSFKDAIDYNPYHLYIDGRNKAATKHFKEYWYEKFRNDLDLFKDMVPDSDMGNFHEYMLHRNKKTRYRYIMFTINFREDVEFDDAFKKFTKFTKKKWIKNHISCFEWRDGTNGMHIHSRVELSGDKDPYQCKREVYNTFRKLVGNKQHVNARYSNRLNCFRDYIWGIKKGRPKYNMSFDQEIRKDLGIPDVIEGSNEVMSDIEKPDG